MNRKELGLEGEKLIVSWFQSKGVSVIQSDDPYDHEKDLLIGSKTVEVKTQTVYRNFPYLGDTVPAFTIPILEDTKISRNQLNKCMNVDYLIFVSRSTRTDRVIRIFLAPKLGKRSFTIVQNKKDGRYVAGFPIKQMKQIGLIEDKEIIEKFMDDWMSA